METRKIKRDNYFWTLLAFQWHWRCMRVAILTPNLIVVKQNIPLSSHTVTPPPPEAPEFFSIFFYSRLKLQHHQGLHDLRRAGRIRRLLLRLHFSRSSLDVLSVSFLLNGFRFLHPLGLQGAHPLAGVTKVFMLTEWTCKIPYSGRDDM